VRRQHHEIADAIDAGDPVAAGDLMHDHLEYLRPHYEKLWEQAKRRRAR
jgi:DNA-binding GntR family transcriptional regulator